MTNFQFSRQFMLPLKQNKFTGQKTKTIWNFMMVGLDPCRFLPQIIHIYNILEYFNQQAESLGRAVKVGDS